MNGWIQDAKGNFKKVVSEEDQLLVSVDFRRDLYRWSWNLWGPNCLLAGYNNLFNSAEEAMAEADKHPTVAAYNTQAASEPEDPPQDEYWGDVEASLRDLHAEGKAILASWTTSADEFVRDHMEFAKASYTAGFQDALDAMQDKLHDLWKESDEV